LLHNSTSSIYIFTLHSHRPHDNIVDTPDKIEVVNKQPGKQEVRDKIPSII